MDDHSARARAPEGPGIGFVSFLSPNYFCVLTVASATCFLLMKKLWPRKVNSKGQLLGDEHITDQTHQFITVASDGQCLIWDTRYQVKQSGYKYYNSPSLFFILRDTNHCLLKTQEYQQWHFSCRGTHWITAHRPGNLLRFVALKRPMLVVDSGIFGFVAPPSGPRF